MKHHAKVERWVEERKRAEHSVNTISAQKNAEAIAENLAIAQNVKKRLLQRLERIEQKYPFDATEVRAKQGDNYIVFRIRDLTAAYKDLTEDMPKEADTTTIDRLDQLLQEAMNAAYGQTS